MKKEPILLVGQAESCPANSMDSNYSIRPIPPGQTEVSFHGLDIGNIPLEQGGDFFIV